LRYIVLVGQHVKEEQKLPVADARQAWPETTRCPPLVLRTDRVFIALPVLPVGRIGDQVVEPAARVAIVR
jgi:hypothetical protein